MFDPVRKTRLGRQTALAKVALVFAVAIVSVFTYVSRFSDATRSSLPGGKDASAAGRWLPVVTPPAAAADPISLPAAAAAVHVPFSAHRLLVPTGGILRANATARPEEPLQFGDFSVLSTFLEGSCAVAVLSRPRLFRLNLTHNFTMALQLGASAAPDAVTRKHWEHAKFVEADMATAAVTVCSDYLLGAAQSVDIDFAYPLTPNPRASLHLTATRGSPPPSPAHHSAICASVRGVTGAHLAMWLDYHRRLGIGHAFIYVNEPWEGFARRLAADGAGFSVSPDHVTFIRWEDHPMWYPRDPKQHVAQMGAYNDCHHRFKRHASYFLFTDVDEFLYVSNSTGRGEDFQAAVAAATKLSSRRSQCGLLWNTWGVIRGRFPLTVDGILNAEFATLGPNKVLVKDPSALGRSKLYAHGSDIGVVGNHNLLSTVNGTLSDCASTDATRVGFVHVITPQFDAVVRPNSRNSSALASEILEHTSVNVSSLRQLLLPPKPKPKHARGSS